VDLVVVVVAAAWPRAAAVDIAGVVVVLGQVIQGITRVVVVVVAIIMVPILITR
tara:strand:- start:347 stop:508 length:162 start_codon:yes stop_codon:yes gene_type:complete